MKSFWAHWAARQLFFSEGISGQLSLDPVGSCCSSITVGFCMMPNEGTESKHEFKNDSMPIQSPPNPMWSNESSHRSKHKQKASGFNGLIKENWVQWLLLFAQEGSPFCKTSTWIDEGACELIVVVQWLIVTCMCDTRQISRKFHTFFPEMHPSGKCEMFLFEYKHLQTMNMGWGGWGTIILDQQNDWKTRLNMTKWIQIPSQNFQGAWRALHLWLLQVADLKELINWRSMVQQIEINTRFLLIHSTTLLKVLKWCVRWC